MYMYVTFCSSVYSVYFTFHCLHCVTIVNMVINIVLCFIPNKLLYFVLFCIYRTHYANTITKQKNVVMRIIKHVHVFRKPFYCYKKHIFISPCSMNGLSIIVLKMKCESGSIIFEQQMMKLCT